MRSALVLLLLVVTPPVSPADERPRLVVLTDIGGDPDDTQSLIRLLVFANEFHIEALIASASGTPGELKESVTRTDLIEHVVAAYGKVQPNLLKHVDGYPTAEELQQRIVSGNPQRGWRFVGEGHDTAGSRRIIEIVDRDDPRPVNITIWGGQTDLAQALWRVKQDRGPAGLAQFAAKIRVYDINDQDDIAPEMRRAFPGLFYILAKAPDGQDKRLGAYRGMYLGGDESLTSREWVETHLRTGHGPLGSFYPMRTWTAPNPHATLKEGDTPSWFYFLPHGLNDPAHPEWGGWGGRFVRSDEEGWYRDAKDNVGDDTSARATVWRWRPYFQNHFQARMDWCVDSPEHANHPPHVVLEGDESRQVIRRSLRRGEAVLLDAAGTTDPDGDPLSYAWDVYSDAGSYEDRVAIVTHKPTRAEVRIPQDAAGTTIHVILSVTDAGAPPLTTFRRIVLVVQ